MTSGWHVPAERHVAGGHPAFDVLVGVFGPVLHGDGGADGEEDGERDGGEEAEEEPAVAGPEVADHLPRTFMPRSMPWSVMGTMRSSPMIARIMPMDCVQSQCASGTGLIQRQAGHCARARSSQT